MSSRSAVALIAAIYFTASPASALPINSVSPPASPFILAQATDTNAQIYIFRGAANVFSLGMDELGNKLQGLGYHPHVSNWKFWSSAADAIIANYQNGQRSPVILIGHSLGANALFMVAEKLRAQHIPVDYMAAFDPTKPATLPSNVLRFVNYYQASGMGRKISAPPGYRGEMINVDLSDRPNISHGNMDEAAKLHELIIGKIQQITTR